MARRPGGEAAIRTRLAASPGLSDAEAHTLAGFLDAESHLAVIPNNGGATWRCECSVALRDDDREILVSYRDKLGLGHLTPVAARNGSRPQVHWKIGSKLECQVLTQLLDAHPLRARKAREYEIWREAVGIWAFERQGLEHSGRARMVQLAEYLRAERVYREPQPDVVLPDMTDHHAPNYFSGFFSGEGSFNLSGRRARFVIKLRRDDRPVLDAFCHDFAIGSVVNVPAIEPWSPAAVWHVTRASDVLKGIDLLIRRRSSAARRVSTGLGVPVRTRQQRRSLKSCRSTNAWSASRDARWHTRRLTALRARRYAPILACPLHGVRILRCSGSGRIPWTDHSRAAPTRLRGAPNIQTGPNAKPSRRRSAAGTAPSPPQASPPGPLEFARLGGHGSTSRGYAALRKRHIEQPSSAAFAASCRLRDLVRQLRVQFDRLHGRQGLRYRAALLRRLGVLLELVVVDSGH
jgi:hypothetical protein